MEGQTNVLETAKNVALERGAERRKVASEKISGFFKGIKEKITKTVDFALGSPDAAAYLGRETVKAGKEKAGEVRDAVVEAATRAKESVIDTKDRLVSRVVDAKNRLVTKYEETRDTTKAKIEELSTRAAVWGLTNIAEPVENRLQQVYELPAVVKEWQSSRAESQAQKHEMRANLTKLQGEARVKALQEQMTAIQEATTRQATSIEGARDAARARSSELTQKAADRREQANQVFGRTRAIVASIQTK